MRTIPPLAAGGRRRRLIIPPLSAGGRSLVTGFRRLNPRLDDFAHHEPGIARLNNGSFGASPRTVIEAEHQHRSWWRANPDAAYFGTGRSSLDARLAAAADTAATALGAPAGSVALVENATVATAIIANRWAKALREDPRGSNGVLLLDICYKAVAYSVRDICEPAGGALSFATVPFPDTTKESILQSLDATLAARKPRYALLDHVSSQPAIVQPLREMIALCRSHGVHEVAVDGAHGLGLLGALDVESLAADFYFTNLHKHAFAPGTSTALHVAESARASTSHVVPSWQAGRGVITESRWPGTRDFAPFLAVPDALAYLAAWRSGDELDAPTYNARGWQAAAAELGEAWGVAPAVADPDLASVGMGMVRLPRSLDLSSDEPGQPSAGVRATLRERYGIEAAVGGFGEHGGFVRLSHAVYTTDEDIRRLREAVSEMADV